MATEAPIDKGSEHAFDDLAKLWKRRKLLCLMLIAVAITPAMVAIVILPKDLRDTKRDRDAKAAQLAPFLALANQRFATAPPDKRLGMLLKTASGAPARVSRKRSLSPESISFIQLKLDLATRVPIRIHAPAGENEAVALAEQIKTLFEGSGFKVEGVREEVQTPPLEGVILRCKRVPADPLRAAILQLFVELGSKPLLSLDESMPESEIVIIVGSR